MARAKVRLAALAQGGSGVPAATQHVATLVRANPWRGVGVALGLGLALGLARGRGARAVAALAGPLGAALATGFLRGVAARGPSPASALDAKLAEVRARSTAG